MNASPKGARSELRGIGAVHDLGDFRNTFARNQTDGVAITSAHQEFGSAIHPVVQTTLSREGGFCLSMKALPNT